MGGTVVAAGLIWQPCRMDDDVTAPSRARTPAGADLGPRWPGRPCAAAAALSVVGERWALLAIREVFFGNHRFNDLARNTGAPPDRLAAPPKDPARAGVPRRHP